MDLSNLIFSSNYIFLIHIQVFIFRKDIKRHKSILLNYIFLYSIYIYTQKKLNIICINNVFLFDLPGPSEVINYYLLSLAVADLLCGLLVVPLSVYPAVVSEWVYGDIICRVIGYLEVTLWAVTVYTFMWISVDRYLSVRKPLRYETLQTKTR